MQASHAQKDIPGACMCTSRRVLGIAPTGMAHTFALVTIVFLLASIQPRGQGRAWLRGIIEHRPSLRTEVRISSTRLSTYEHAHQVQISRAGPMELNSSDIQNLDVLEWDSNVQMRDLLARVMCRTAFGVMASSVKGERSAAQIKTWMSHFHRTRMVILSDKSDADLGIRSVPAYTETSRKMAQQRSIESILLAHKENPTAEFIVGIDDDTFVNLFTLSRQLVRFPVDQAAMGGHIVQTRRKPPYTPSSWPWGGGGMIFNRKAIVAIAQAFDTGVCGRSRNNDITFAECREKLGIWMVHTPLLEGTYGTWGFMMNHSLIHDHNLAGKATLHKVEAPDMKLLYRLWRKYYGEPRIELFEQLMAKECGSGTDART